MQGIILKTINAGSTWTVQTSGTTNNLWSVYFTDASIGYIVGDSGIILKTTNGGVGISELFSIEKNISIYPNPTNENITIEIPEKATIEILNINGQIIKTINHDSGETLVDIGDLSSGVYIIKAKTDKEIVTKKIIKE